MHSRDTCARGPKHLQLAPKVLGASLGNPLPSHSITAGLFALTLPGELRQTRLEPAHV